MTGLTVSTPRHGVLDVELDRAPDNLMTVPLCQRLTDLLLRPPEGAHVLRLRAAGEVFCLGRERPAASAGELRDETRVLVELHQALRGTALVTIAQVHGHAAGFGVGMIAACDVAVAIENAQFWFPEVDIDLAPAIVLAWLPQLVGEREAFWLTATGERLPALAAKQLGLINEVVADGAALADEVERRVAALRAHSPRVHTEIKEMLRLSRVLDEDSALAASVDRLVVGALRRTEGKAEEHGRHA
jgi:methylglutaconyl-CoA hydratase